MTLNDRKRQNRGFYGFLAISGCDTNLYHSQGGATELSLCDPDRQFGICIRAVKALIFSTHYRSALIFLMH